MSSVFAAITSCGVCLNSTINPLIYGFLNQDFKNTYKELIKKLFGLCMRRRLLTRNSARVSSITVAKRSSERPTITANAPATDF